MVDYIDLRSDTVTRPTGPMLAAMVAAEVGDDVYGEDPTVNALEEKVAELLGKEAALFVPSGTMANQLAIHLHCRPGESVICERDSHIFLYEAGAAAANSGVQFDLVEWEDGFSDAAIEKSCHAESLHAASTSLLAVENTHNRQAGRVLGVKDLKRIVNKARSLNLATHCDGARIWNAAVALSCSEKELLAGFDSVAVCFSKGLGAPVGSALCANRIFVEKARKIRKRWGGGMRQVGYLAAAALYALDHHRSSLKKDHDHAEQIAAGLKEVFSERALIRYPNPGTNLLYFQIKGIPGETVAEKLKAAGVLVMVLAGNWVRVVTHLQILPRHIDRILSTLKTAGA